MRTQSTLYTFFVLMCHTILYVVRELVNTSNTFFCIITRYVTSILSAITVYIMRSTLRFCRIDAWEHLLLLAEATAPSCIHVHSALGVGSCDFLHAEGTGVALRGQETLSSKSVLVRVVVLRNSACYFFMAYLQQFLRESCYSRKFHAFFAPFLFYCC